MSNIPLTGFVPIADTQSRILILGTFPSVESLNQQQYYAHPRNHFWPILFKLFDEPFSLRYEDRVKLLLKHGVALWDVLTACIREGSYDSNIEMAQPNPIPDWILEHPKLSHIVFNGQNARNYFFRFQLHKTITIPTSTLPSTSPANARMSLAAKSEKWELIKTLTIPTKDSE
jgi:hypoxanthine-DNA glycosylase